MAESSAERKTRNETIRIALAEFRLLGDMHDGRVIAPEGGEGLDEARDFIVNLCSSLYTLREELDSGQDNAMRMEKRTAGLGRLDDDLFDEDDDDDVPQMTMMTVRNSKPSFTRQGRNILACAEKCRQILFSDRMSVRDADILVRNLRFLMDIPVLEAVGLRQSSDFVENGLLTYAFDKSGKVIHIDKAGNGLDCGCTCPGCRQPLIAKNAGNKNRHHFAHQKGSECRLRNFIPDAPDEPWKQDVRKWLDGIWNSISAEPYTRLASMLEEMFGTGALRELQGILPSEKDRTVSRRLETPEDLCSLSVCLGALREQEKTGWDARFASEVRTISRDLMKRKKESPQMNEEKRILASYAGLGEVPATASECLSAARKAETDAGKLRVLDVYVKDVGDVSLPVSGLGHIFNPARYRNKDENGASPVEYVKGLFSSAYSLYSGRQAIQNKILTAARILCGQDPEERGDEGGKSWFGSMSASYLRAVPINLRGIAGEDLTSLCTTWFAVDSALSKLEAMPVEFLPAGDPLVEEIRKERENCSLLLGRLSEAVGRIITEEPDFSLGFNTDGVDAGNFHLLETPAAPGLGESRLPYEIAKDKMRDFVTGLLSDRYQKTEEERTAMISSLSKCFSADDTDAWKTFMTRLCETAGFRPSSYPSVHSPDGRTVTLPESDPDDKRCRELACKWILDQITGITDRRSPVLSSMLEAFSSFPSWNEMYGETVHKQKMVRKDFEKARAVQWLDVLRSSRKILSEPSDELGGMTYTQAVTASARDTNVMISGLLSDTVMRRTARMVKDEAVNPRSGKLAKEDVGRIYSHFLDISEEKPVERDPVEDFACSVFIRPVLRQSLAQARRNIERNFNKQIDEEDRTTSDTVRRSSDLMFLKSGGVMDFGSDIVMSDERLSRISEAAVLHRSALEMSALTEEESEGRDAVLRYAEENLDNLVLESLCGSVTEEECEIAQASMDAVMQKELLDRALALWTESREAMTEGRMPEAASALADAEQCIRDAYRNNPLLDQERRLIPMMESDDDRVADVLREERWASPDARFSERMSDEDDRVPESVLLEASREWMAQQKAECCRAYEKASSLSALEIEDVDRAVAVARAVVSSVADVFSPVAGVLMDRGIRDGASAMSFMHTVETARNNLRTEMFREMEREFLVAVAEMGSRLDVPEDRTWKPGTRDPGIGYVMLSTKTDTTSACCAGDPQSPSVEENRLYDVVPRKGTSEKDGGWKALTDRMRAMAPENGADYGAQKQKALFTSGQRKTGSRLEKWNAAQDAGVKRFAERARQKAELLMG